MKIVINFLVLIFFSSLSYAQSIVPAGKGEEAMLGKGYNPDTQSFQGRCLKGNAEEYGQPVANVDFSQSISQSELANELGFGAGGRYRYGMAEVSASAKFFKQQQSSSFSISSVYSGEYKFRNLVLNFNDSDNSTNNTNADLKLAKLSDVGRSVYENDQRWLDTCGTEYVEQIERGAKLFYSIRIDFSSTEEKQVFEAAFNYESSYASVQAYLKSSSRNFSKNTKVTIGALQIGGDVSKVTELFNAENDNQSAMGFIQCTFGDFSKCDKVMETAWNYATKEFKKQLDLDPNKIKNGGGPAYLTYRTKKYSTAGVYSNLPSIVNYAIQKVRKQLERYFDKQIDYLGEIRQLLYGKTVVLSPRQRKNINNLEKIVGANLEKLVSAAKACYDQPSMCIEVVNDLADNQDGIQTIDESMLVVVPETFLQFCNFSQSPLVPENLKQSIVGMIEAAKEMEPSAFQADSSGKTDSCLISHMVFSQTNNAIFSGRNISTIEPLKEYKNFVSIDFSNNSIEDISTLAGFQNLENLNLHNNKIRDVSTLSELRSLHSLRVSNNSLRDISDLKSSIGLQRVDARNNFPTVSCEELKNISVCLSSSVRTEISFIPVATKTSTPFFMPSVARLGDDQVFILGYGKSAQIFTSVSNTFESLGDIGVPSFGHVTSSLNDGRILTTGGWGTLKRLAIFDPIQKTFFVNNNGLKVPRAGHQLTVLKDGRILITGGWEGGATWTGTNASYTAEIFDPTTNSSALVSNMHAPRAWHTATLLNDGRVLIVGGFSHNGSLASSEIFDPITNSFEVVKKSMHDGRSAHTATVLDNGRVLLVGGFSNYSKALSTAEIFDPTHNDFTLISEQLNIGRGAHSAIKLKNGRVVITGGSSEVYAPSSPLPSSDVFISTGEVFDPSENSFAEIPTKMFLPRSNHSMIEIKDGMVLIIGGLSWDAATNSEALSYTNF